MELLNTGYKCNQQDIKRSEIQSRFCSSRVLDGNTFTMATAKTHCLYNPVHINFDYENENLKDILFHTGVLVVYKPHRHLWVLFFFFFVVIEYAILQLRIVLSEGTSMAWRQTLPLHVDLSEAYITRWLKQTWIAGTQVMELHQRFLHVPLSYGQGVFLRIIKATIFCLLDFLCSFVY